MDDLPAQIERYRQLRAWFDRLVVRVQAHDAALPGTLTHTVIDPDWLLEVVSYQDFACQRCGDFLFADALGPCAYAHEDFTRVCSVYYR